MKCLTDLDSFFWIGNMFVTQVLEWNEPRDSVVQSCPNTDRLARTPTSVKMTPHLHSTAPSTSSQCYSLTTRTGNAFLSANHTRQRSSSESEGSRSPRWAQGSLSYHRTDTATSWSHHCGPGWLPPAGPCLVVDERCQSHGRLSTYLHTTATSTYRLQAHL